MTKNNPVKTTGLTHSYSIVPKQGLFTLHIVVHFNHETLEEPEKTFETIEAAKKYAEWHYANVVCKKPTFN